VLITRQPITSRLIRRLPGLETLHQGPHSRELVVSPVESALTLLKKVFNHLSSWLRTGKAILVVLEGDRTDFLYQGE
jgi:hypothetical protein